MATQAMLIADTIEGMKRAMKRQRKEDTDSDDSFDLYPSRANQRKRKSQFLQDGQLSLRDGSKNYKRKIEHAGYQRYIMYRNPPRLDNDGEEIDEDISDELADAAFAEDNAFSDLKLEEFLAPLTAASDLPNHPTLSLPYYSEHLTKLAENAVAMVQKERATLWTMKDLLTRFRGDQAWAPLGIFESENDAEFFLTDSNRQLFMQATSASLDQTEQAPADLATERSSTATADDTNKDLYAKNQEDDTGIADQSNLNKAETNSPEDVTTEKPAEQTDPPVINGDIVTKPGSDNQDKDKEGLVGRPATSPARATTIDETSKQEEAAGAAEAPTDSHVINGDHPPTPAPEAEERVAEAEDEDETTSNKIKQEDETTALPPPHRMTTRAQAQAVSDPSNPSNPSSPSSSTAAGGIPQIHPIFIVPTSSIPDRDYGLPTPEAEDIRRLLLLYVQKQEEVVRGAQKLADGLLRVDRLRKEVMRWAKAEGHVGELSDGEDWYDAEAWGLGDEELKKGMDEEEEDTGVQGKKTRNRRQ